MEVMGVGLDGLRGGREKKEDDGIRVGLRTHEHQL